MAVMSSVPGAGAQDKAGKKSPPDSRIERREIVIDGEGPDAHGPHGGSPSTVRVIKDDTFVFVSSEMSFGGKVVKNAPYSAQAVTETVQTLGDGNRIVRKNSASVYRDGEGRTRRDQEIGAIGPFASAGEPSRTAFINDPVAHVNYVLDPRSKTARKLPVFDFKFEPGRDKEGVQYKFEMRGGGDAADKNSAGQVKHLPPPPAGAKEGERHEFIFGGAMPPPPLPGGPADMPNMEFYRQPSNADTKTEKLDTRTIEGVQAEGTRTTTTIAAGEIGNEQPVVITSERWYSPELQTVIMTRHSDPRFGETIYRLTGISRSEPAATLFQVPGDYTVKEAPPMTRRMHRAVPPPEN